MARADNQVGKLGAQLLSSTGVGGTINLGQNWTGATVNAPDFVKIICEPAMGSAQSPNYEVIGCTVVNGSPTATIQVRPLEGTTAVTHQAGTVWACGATSLDFPPSQNNVVSW